MSMFHTCEMYLLYEMNYAQAAYAGKLPNATYLVDTLFISMIVDEMI